MKWPNQDLSSSLSDSKSHFSYKPAQWPSPLCYAADVPPVLAGGNLLCLRHIVITFVITFCTFLRAELNFQKC